MFNQQNRALYTRKEIAAMLGVGSLTIAAWEKQGCPAVYIGKLTNGKGSRPRYDLEKVKSWLDSHQNEFAGDAEIHDVVTILTGEPTVGFLVMGKGDDGALYLSDGRICRQDEIIVLIRAKYVNPAAIEHMEKGYKAIADARATRKEGKA